MSKPERVFNVNDGVLVPTVGGTCDIERVIAVTEAGLPVVRDGSRYRVAKSIGDWEICGVFVRSKSWFSDRWDFKPLGEVLDVDCKPKALPS